MQAFSSSCHSENSQRHKPALTTRGVEKFILLDPSDSCLRSCFILNATEKRGGKTELIKCGGACEGMAVEHAWGEGCCISPSKVL